MNKFFATLWIIATGSFAQGMDEGSSVGNTGHGSHHPGEGMHGETSTSPEAKAKAEVEPIAKALALGIESRDSLQKYFTRYYLDVAFYGDKMTERLQQSLFKQRDQRVCKTLDSILCTNYLEFMHNDPRGQASAAPDSEHSHGKKPMQHKD